MPGRWPGPDICTHTQFIKSYISALTKDSSFSLLLHRNLTSLISRPKQQALWHNGQPIGLLVNHVRCNSKVVCLIPPRVNFLPVVNAKFSGPWYIQCICIKYYFDILAGVWLTCRYLNIPHLSFDIFKVLNMLSKEFDYKHMILWPLRLSGCQAILCICVCGIKDAYPQCLPMTSRTNVLWWL